MFERIAEEMERLYDGKIETLSILAVDADLTEFFEKTNYKSRWKINKALRNSGLEIVKIKHRRRRDQKNHLATYVTFYVNADFAPVRKQRIYSNTW